MAGLMLKMTVSRLAVDPLTNLPVLVLADSDGREAMEIGIGLGEASAIATELAKVALQRPATHDLMKTVIGECGARVERVELRDVRHDTFYAAIILERPRRDDGSAPVLIEIDARPSDAIALALRTGAAIRVASKVVKHCRVRDVRRQDFELPRPEMQGGGRMGLLADDEVLACGGLSDEDSEGFPLLETLRDEDFGKWKM